jgi:hypothetical protein
MKDSDFTVLNIYHYTTSREMVICESDGVIDDHISHQ